MMQYYRRQLENESRLKDHYESSASDEAYLDKMEKILSASPCIGVPREPTQLVGSVYIGSTANAENIASLKSLGINYVLNCAATELVRHRRVRSLYPAESGIQGYDELPLEDNDYCDIRAYFDRALAFIHYANTHNGKVLIHCPGVSRSGAIAIMYLMNCGYTLIEATKLLKDKRRTALCNSHFMRQLIKYARDRGLLETAADLESVRAPVFHRRLNSYRINSAHLPLYV